MMMETEYLGVPPSTDAFGENTLAYEKRTLPVTIFTLVACVMMLVTFLNIRTGLQ